MVVDTTTSWLLFNALLQTFISTILGFIMLVPLQPWGKFFTPYLPSTHAMLAVHLDWYMLAFMESLIASIFYIYPKLSSQTISNLLIFGGWVNPLAYLLRDLGINAFVFGGDVRQLIAATISGISALSIIFALGLLLRRFYSLLQENVKTA
jgi:hypothetical protein